VLLGELPESLLSEGFLTVGARLARKEGLEELELLVKTIQSMHPDRQYLLTNLCEALSLQGSHVDAQVWSALFGPALLWSRDSTDWTMKAGSPHCELIVETLIRHFMTIFREETPRSAAESAVEDSPTTPRSTGARAAANPPESAAEPLQAIHDEEEECRTHLAMLCENSFKIKGQLASLQEHHKTGAVLLAGSFEGASKPELQAGLEEIRQKKVDAMQSLHACLCRKVQIELLGTLETPMKDLPSSPPLVTLEADSPYSSLSSSPANEGLAALHCCPQASLDFEVIASSMVSGHVEYVYVVSLGALRWGGHQRYSNFLQLHQTLQRLTSGPLPSFPGQGPGLFQRFRGGRGSQAVAERSLGLEVYLRALLTDRNTYFGAQQMMLAQPIKDFICIDAAAAKAIQRHWRRRRDWLIRKAASCVVLHGLVTAAAARHESRRRTAAAACLQRAVRAMLRRLQRLSCRRALQQMRFRWGIFAYQQQQAHEAALRRAELQRLREEEARQAADREVLQAQSQLKGLQLMNESRRLVLTGSLVDCSSCQRPNRHLHLFLFTDMLILAANPARKAGNGAAKGQMRESSRGPSCQEGLCHLIPPSADSQASASPRMSASPLSPTKQLVPCCIIRRQEANIVDIASVPGMQHAFRIYSRPNDRHSDYLLKASSAKEKSQWLEALAWLVNTDQPHSPRPTEPFRFDWITIPNTRQASDPKGQVFTTYCIDAARGGRCWKVQRRFSEFEELWQRLKQLKLPANEGQLPQLPGKLLFRMSPSVIAQRRHELERCLQRLLMCVNPAVHTQLMKFLNWPEGCDQHRMNWSEAVSEEDSLVAAEEGESPPEEGESPPIEQTSYSSPVLYLGYREEDSPPPLQLDSQLAHLDRISEEDSAEQTPANKGPPGCTEWPVAQLQTRFHGEESAASCGAADDTMSFETASAVLDQLVSACQGQQPGGAHDQQPLSGELPAVVDNSTSVELRAESESGAAESQQEESSHGGAHDQQPGGVHDQQPLKETTGGLRSRGIIDSDDEQAPVDLSGTWKLVNNTGLQDFLALQGVSYLARKAADMAPLTQIITQHAKSYRVQSQGLISSDHTLFFGDAPVTTVLQGTTFEDTAVILEGGKGIQVRKFNRAKNCENVIVRKLDESGMRLVSTMRCRFLDKDRTAQACQTFERIKS